MDARARNQKRAVCSLLDPACTAQLGASLTCTKAGSHAAHAGGETHRVHHSGGIHRCPWWAKRGWEGGGESERTCGGVWSGGMGMGVSVSAWSRWLSRAFDARMRSGLANKRARIILGGFLWCRRGARVCWGCAIGDTIRHGASGTAWEGRTLGVSVRLCQCAERGTLSDVQSIVAI